MGFLASLFGNSEVVETAAKGLYNGIDQAFFTDEEKSTANQKVLDWTLKYMAATNPQNVARRFIALVVVGLWAALVVAGVIAQTLGSQEIAAFIFDTLKNNVNTPFGIIIGFYFLAHVVRNSALGQKS